MSRRRAAEVRKVIPDPVYNNEILSKFMNCLMLEGKKSIAETVVYTSLKTAESELKKNGLEIFLQAIENLMPTVEVRSRRIGGATYQIPTEIRKKRSFALAIRWLIQAARARKEKSMQERLAKEIVEAYNNRGSAIKKRDDTHKMAEANRAFSHFKTT